MNDRYEVRRLALKALIDEKGRGGTAEVANRIGKEPSYVSRMLYPPGKTGRKRIGDELLEAITKAYPSWLDRAAQPTGAAAPASAAAPRAHAPGDYIAFQLFARDDGSALANALLPVAKRLELAAWEVQRRLGYRPAPDRIQLFTQMGSSMRPILQEGDIAFIDTAVTDFVGDDCYLIGTGDDVQIKLLQRRGADMWVVSPNPIFPAWCGTEADIVIRGRLVLHTGLRSVVG